MPIASASLTGTAFPINRPTTLTSIERPGSTNLYFLGKLLEDRSFTERYSAILFRVTETTAPKAEELRGHRRGRLIPLHPSVDGSIALSAALRVTIGEELARPIPPCSTRLGGAYALKIEWREAAGLMQRVGFADATRFETR